jgi:pantetheine-phosphate adenylyltransferase
VVVTIFPGRFDPVTYGHLDIIIRASSLFNQVIVAVRPVPEQKLLFSLNERIKMLEHLTHELPNIQVLPCCEAILDFARKHHARIIIRGLRSFNDFEMEFERAKLNKELAPEIETIFITCRPELFYTSEMKDYL